MKKANNKQEPIDEQQKKEKEKEKQRELYYLQYTDGGIFLS